MTTPINLAELKADAPRPTVRAAARARLALDGADAQALEHALTITERERDAAVADHREFFRGYLGVAMALGTEHVGYRADRRVGSYSGPEVLVLAIKALQAERDTALARAALAEAAHLESQRAGAVEAIARREAVERAEDERARADANWSSYERVRDSLSTVAAKAAAFDELWPLLKAWVDTFGPLSTGVIISTPATEVDGRLLDAARTARARLEGGA